VSEPDETRNRAFFARFVPTGAAGCILGARHRGRLVGYACLYFTMSSVEAEDIVIMNDLYVVPDARGDGVGRRLIEATMRAARARPVRRVRWSTAIDNRRAQRLYEQMGAERSTWFEYEVIVDP
jgi:GNAT superfamily N-acetyltransferase